MTKAALINKRPFLISVKCKQLKGIEHDGYHFEGGVYIALVSGHNKREVITTALEHISEISGEQIHHLNCVVLAIQEVSAEKAESFQKILTGARPQDEIDF